MLSLQRIQNYLEGCPKGPWVDYAIGEHKVPRLSRELITANLSDPEIMCLWGDYRDRRGWDKNEWREYLLEDYHTGYSEFSRWLLDRFGRN